MSNTEDTTVVETTTILEEPAVLRESARQEGDVPRRNVLVDIYEDQAEVTSDLPVSQLRPNPVVEVGKINAFEDAYPKWSTRTMESLEELPDETIPVESAIDLTNGEIVVTRFSYYEQRNQSAIGRDIDFDKATEGDLNTQAEIDIAIPRATFGFLGDAESLDAVLSMLPPEGRRLVRETGDGRFFLPHSMYTNARLSRMRARALVAYVKTRFNAPEDLVMKFHDQLMSSGFEFVQDTRERAGEMRRRMKFNIQAPLVGNPTSTQLRLRQQQDTGFRLRSFTLVAPRAVETRYRDGNGATRPEFEGFAWHMADNIRWADVLTADGAEGLQAFSLTTAITGIDHRSADDTRPMGNALRATVQSVTYEHRVPDDLILQGLGLPAGIGVTPEIRALASSKPGLAPEVTEINFFGSASNVAYES